MKRGAGDIDFCRAPYNNHGASLQPILLAHLLPIYCARPLIEQSRTAASAWRAITKYPPCRRWRLLRPRGRCGNRSDCTGHRQQPRKHATHYSKTLAWRNAQNKLYRKCLTILCKRLALSVSRGAAGSFCIYIRFRLSL